ncbi:MAG: DUF6226 family protein [Cellulomonadaceae bacterium]|jgi:hypothetical protein|nr:DUF6226 family protein [Cellulomonadaceae bacterium]
MWESSTYQRPALPAEKYVDSSGNEFEYGKRYWAGHQDAPREAYSVVTHPDRFEPLWAIADELVAALVRDFDVDVSDDVAEAVAANGSADWFVRGVKVTPRSPDSAPITILWLYCPIAEQASGGQGLARQGCDVVNHFVRINAGSIYSVPYPDCGCDACDDSVAGFADAMEWAATALTTGWLTETSDGYFLKDPTGYGQGSSGLGWKPWSPSSLTRRKKPNESITWQPWPRRQSAVPSSASQTQSQMPHQTPPKARD